MKMKGRRTLIFLLVSLALVSPVWALQDSENPKDWFARARTDLDDAQLISEKTTHYEQVCFLAHQSVEKSLKGALIGHQLQPEKIHLTADLLTQLAQIRPELGSHLAECRSLDRLYVPSRYPKMGITFTQEKASECLEEAKRLLDLIQERAR